MEEDAEDADMETDLEPGEHRPVKRPRSAGATALDQVHSMSRFVSWQNRKKLFVRIVFTKTW